ncbi:MAG: hypothetical protein QNJ22_02195 [Desulfosarcinaceae bacterium]|nr:hypothetical protein [Desulfosarcinaceae bacterium]
MWRIQWSQTLQAGFFRQSVDPWSLIGDAVSMTLVVAVSALATLAYGL